MTRSIARAPALGSWRTFRRSAVAGLPAPVADALRAGRRGAVLAAARLRIPPALTSFPPVTAAPVRLLVGPANFAGQGRAWAQAAAEHVPGVEAQAFAVATGPFAYPADYSVDTATYRHPHWAYLHERHVTGSFSHVLLEAGRPLFGLRYGSDSAADARRLTRAGVHVALVAHGSDVRSPSRHAEREPESPFAPVDEQTRWLEVRSRRVGGLFRAFDGPTFVSTPDLLLDVPAAQWLPVTVRPDDWAGGPPVLTRRVPVVVHAPTNPRLKGSDVVDAVLGRLEARGAVRYLRVTGIPAAEVPGVFRGADVVVDQLRMGLYGVAACEAMAAGRVVVGYVGDHVRSHVRSATGLHVPVVEATTTTLADVIDRLLDDPPAARATAEEGPAFVRQVHDGRLAAQALMPWLLGRP